MYTISREAVMKEIDEMIGEVDSFKIQVHDQRTLFELKSRIESIPQEPTVESLLEEMRID